MPGPPPKPAHLRQRTNRKAGARTLEAHSELPAHVPALPNPDQRDWHPMTLVVWREWWESEMAAEWLQTDIAGLGLVAMLYDEFYKKPSVETLKEIRLQRQCFGLTPIDRSRLQWEIFKGEDSERKRSRPVRPSSPVGRQDPRRILTAVK